MDPFVRPLRRSVRPYSGLQASITSYWSNLANGTINAIDKRTVPKGGSYDVAATIRDSGGTVVTSGSYDSTTGIHAEIAALGACPPTSHATLTVSPPPCKRCAVILAYFRTKFGWTVVAPEKKFASTYQGAYHLPDYLIDDVLLSGLVAAGKITEGEAALHRSAIVTEFCTGAW
jgi:hypothetical protein